MATESKLLIECAVRDKIEEKSNGIKTICDSFCETLSYKNNDRDCLIIPKKKIRMMSKDKREPEYPIELESQFILRLPDDPAKVLKDILKTGEDLKNRLTIQVENDMRHGEVCLDNWNMHAKIVDLPTITESIKTIDKKSFYKTADICQMMICTEEPDKPSTEDESPAKNKKKDPYKVDKKFLWPHGITPPTKNIRKRRFRKTLKKKCADAPEIEREVKRLLRADNEAISISWEVIQEDEEHNTIPTPSAITHLKPEKKGKAERSSKRESTSDATNQKSSNVVDIFGGAVSDSDAEEENITGDLEDSHLSAYDSRLSDTNSLLGLGETSTKKDNLLLEFGSHMFQSSVSGNTAKNSSSSNKSVTHTATSINCGGISSEDEGDYPPRDMSKEDMTLRIEQLRVEVEEMKQRRQRTRLEIAGMENVTLRQRFQDILHTLNQDIMYKEMEYQGMITLQNSEDI